MGFNSVFKELIKRKVYQLEARQCFWLWQTFCYFIIDLCLIKYKLTIQDNSVKIRPGTWTVRQLLMVNNLYRSCSCGQSAESAPGRAAGDRRTTGMLRGGFPQYHQLLGEEQRRNVAGWVSSKERYYWPSVFFCITIASILDVTPCCTMHKSCAFFKHSGNFFSKLHVVSCRETIMLTVT
jgi:hypothetical protein